MFCMLTLAGFNDQRNGSCISKNNGIKYEEILHPFEFLLNNYLFENAINDC